MKKEKVFFKNNKGQKLCGYLYFPDGKGPFPAVIICHGLSTAKEANSVVQSIPLFMEEKFAIFAFDFHGHGESEGKFEDVTITQAIDDLKCAINFLIKQQNIDTSKIGLYGGSFGGQVAINVAVEDDRIKVLALRAPVINYKDSIERRRDEYTFDVKTWKEKDYIMYDAWQGPRRLNYSYYLDATKYNKLELAKKIKIPTIITTGTKDDVVIPEIAKKFYEDLACEKKIVWLENQTHKWSAESKKKAFKATVDWFKKYLK